MKKIRVLFTLSLLALVLGCSKNSDNAADDGPATIDKRANLLGTGDSANDLLSNDKFTEIKIEIAYVTGFRPTAAAMTDFVEYIKRHTFKEEIELLYSELDSPEKETLTLQEIVELEEENRTIYNSGETLGIYIYFADAPSDSDEEDENNTKSITLGAVYRNTSMIIYEKTVRDLAGISPFILEADVESATINHEFGHLFGLVDLGSNQVNEHEDPEAESHCIVSGCLMQAQLNFNASGKTSNRMETGELKPDCALTATSVLKMLEANSAKSQGIAPNLDPECMLDLKANGGR